MSTISEHPPELSTPARNKIAALVAAILTLAYLGNTLNGMTPSWLFVVCVFGGAALAGIISHLLTKKLGPSDVSKWIVRGLPLFYIAIFAAADLSWRTSLLPPCNPYNYPLSEPLPSACIERQRLDDMEETLEQLVRAFFALLLTGSVLYFMFRHFRSLRTFSQLAVGYAKKRKLVIAPMIMWACACLVLYSLGDFLRGFSEESETFPITLLAGIAGWASFRWYKGQ